MGITNRFEVRFWGVRGSIATGGPSFARVGGNTSCVELRIGDETIILDAGTGLLPLGQGWGARTRATFFFSHFHWDHLQGFPFFAPAYLPGNTFTLYASCAVDLRASLDRQMQPPNFPVTLAAMSAQLECRSIRPSEEIQIGVARIRAAALNHPQGCLGFRISVGESSVVYATDTEPAPPGALEPALLDLAHDATLLIHDAQYTDDEYAGYGGPAREGWGHSTVTEACRVAHAAGVAQLALFHHDPAHDDVFIQRLEDMARRHFRTAFAAREGMCVDLRPGEMPETNVVSDTPHALRSRYHSVRAA